MTPAEMRRLGDATRQIKRSTEFRNVLIRKAAREGHTLREIAAAAGLSHTAIANIVKKAER